MFIFFRISSKSLNGQEEMFLFQVEKYNCVQLNFDGRKTANIHFIRVNIVLYIM